MGCGHAEDTRSIVDINPEWILVVFVVATEVDEANLQVKWKSYIQCTVIKKCNLQ